VSLVILPTLTALTGNFRVNATQIDRSTASTKATQTIQGFQNLHFRNLQSALDNEGDYIIFNRNTGCSDLRSGAFIPSNDILIYTSNSAACQNIFEKTINNFEFTEENMEVYVYPLEVYVYPYAVLAEDEAAYIDSIENSDLPPDVQTSILNNISTGQSLNILRVIVRIEYGSGQYILRTGLITPRVEVRPN